MTEKEVERGKEIIEAKETLECLRRIMLKPFPKIGRESKILFWEDTNVVNFVLLDAKTREGLRKVIVDYVNERIDGLTEELEEM